MGLNLKMLSEAYKVEVHTVRDIGKLRLRILYHFDLGDFILVLSLFILSCLKLLSSSPLLLPSSHSCRYSVPFTLLSSLFGKNVWSCTTLQYT
jgi:hypothetical protein